jgi:hypothetical protein
VRADTTPANRAAAEARVRTWLLESWRTYRAICGR